MKLFKKMMLVWTILICAGLIPAESGVGAAFSKAAISPDLTVEEVTEHVYVVCHAFPWPANSLVVEMNNGTMVLVDTPYTPGATRDLLAWMKEQFGERPCIAINSHFHLDNLGGNAALAEAGIPVYGSDLTVKLVEERGEEARALLMSWLTSPADQRFHDDFAALTYVSPTRVFPIAENPVLKLGDETVEIYYPGESHAPDDVVVYFPDRKLLFGSCMVKALEDTGLGNLADASLTEWPESIAKVTGQFPDAEIVIPGHGQWGGPELLRHTMELLDR